MARQCSYHCEGERNYFLVGILKLAEGSPGKLTATLGGNLCAYGIISIGKIVQQSMSTG